MMQALETWEGTANALLSTRIAVSGMANGLPVDATRMGKKVRELVSTLATNSIVVQELKRGKRRGIRLDASGANNNPNTCQQDI